MSIYTIHRLTTKIYIDIYIYIYTPCPEKNGTLEMHNVITDNFKKISVIQLGPLSSDAMFEVVEISDACFVHILLQYTPHAVVNQI